MSQISLGRLEKVELRDIWTTEAGDFTPWLAQADNIKLLGDTIGIELEVEAQEKAVGPFRADILCKDTANEQWVLIENQLERTDHTHLGQLLTYAAGLNAVTIVWVAARFTEEHRATLDWLNEITNESFNFFGLEVELWKIGDSAVAPKFNAVCKPNGWSKAITGAAINMQTEMKQLQYEYWAAFKAYATEHATRIKPVQPQYQNWITLAIGRSGFSLAAIASSWDSSAQSYLSHEIRAEFNITDKASKDYFALLEAEKQLIESGFGEPLVWYNQPDVRICRIYARRSVNLNDRHNWNEQHQWLVEKLDKLHEIFSGRVRHLSLNPGDTATDTGVVL